MNHPTKHSRFRRALAKARQRGFSLLEIALVLVIVGLALGGIASALGPQLENKKVSDTQDRIKQASDAIMAFAMVNRRLPCPATLASNGLEVVSPGPSGVRGQCANPNNGFVPARTLGLGEQGPTGLMQDPWAFGLRYGVSQNTYNGAGNPPVSVNCAATCYPFTQVDGLKNAYYLSGAQITVPPAGLLEVCASSTGNTPTTCGAAVRLVRAGFVVWSTARNGAQLPGGGGADEAANLDNNVVYVFHPRTEAGGAGGAFDDLFQWQTTDAVVSNMTKAGVLP